eukprot:gene17682-19447_t
MGKIFIFVGQFGNQIGLKLLNAVRFQEKIELEDGDFVVAVDTEQKVVNGYRKFFSKSRKEFREVVARKGRGSNWAMGYNLQCEISDTIPLKQKVVQLVQSHLERAVLLSGFVVVHSLIGGTGGGLGSAIVESLKEEFPSRHVTSITNGPFASGESPLQHYNALLTLAWLQRFADSVMLFHNDDLMHEVMRSSRVSAPGRQSNKISLDEMNECACYCIGNLLYPFSREPGTLRLSTPLLKAQQRESRFVSQRGCQTDAKSRTVKIRKEIPGRGGNSTCSSNDKARDIHSCFDACSLEDSDPVEDWIRLLEYLTPNNRLKFIASYPKRSKAVSTDYKKTLLSLLRDVPKSDPLGSRFKNAATCLVARGECFKSFEYERRNVIDTIRQKLLSTDQGAVDLWNTPVCVPEYTYPQVLTLYLNNSRNADFLSHVIEKSRLMYDQSAYLHWYTKFDCTKDYFEEAFELLSGVVREYKEL